MEDSANLAALLSLYEGVPRKVLAIDLGVGTKNLPRVLNGERRITEGMVASMPPAMCSRMREAMRRHEGMSGVELMALVGAQIARAA